MKFFRLFLAFVALTCLAVASSGQKLIVERSQTDVNVLKTVDIEKGEIRDALRSLFKACDKSWSIAPEVQGTVTVYLRNVTFQTALDNLLKQVNATSVVEGGVYLISKREEPPPQRPTGFGPGLVVQLDSNPQSIERILKDLQNAGLRHQFDGGVCYILGKNDEHIARISIESNRTDKVLASDEQFIYEYRSPLLAKVRKADHKIVGSCDLDGSVGMSPASSHLTVRRDTNKPETIQKLDLFLADVREVVPALFKGSGRSYTLDPLVKGLVNLQLENVPFETALQAVLRQVGATYRAQPLYAIVPKEEPTKVIRLLDPEEGTYLSVTDMVNAGMRYRVEGGIYVMLDPKGKVLGRIDAGENHRIPVTQDRDFLYLDLGLQRVKVRKSDLKIDP